MEFADTHAHLDYFSKNGSLESVLERAFSSGVGRIVACSTNPSDWPLYRTLSDKFPENIYWQVGIHPSDIDESSLHFAEALSSYFSDSKPPVAIGEIGLDYYRLPGDSEASEKIVSAQRQLFRRQLEFAKDLNCKVCVHARDSLGDCIEDISSVGVDFSNVVFHCFSGSAEQVKRLNALGARASFTGIITYKSAEQMRRAMLAQGLERVMFETDCPYLAPMPHRGKTNEPSLLPLVVRAAAEIFSISAEDMAKISLLNSREFFGI